MSPGMVQNIITGFIIGINYFGYTGFLPVKRNILNNLMFCFTSYCLRIKDLDPVMNKHTATTVDEQEKCVQLENGRSDSKILKISIRARWMRMSYKRRWKFSEPWTWCPNKHINVILFGIWRKKERQRTILGKIWTLMSISSFQYFTE